MLNELSQVVDSLERLKTVAPSRHPRINPMGKNRELIIASLDKDGKPSRIEVISGEDATRLFRVEHGSAGSSFPGFNIPVPFRRLDDAPANELKIIIERILAVGKSKTSSASEIAEAIQALFNLSAPQTFSTNQEKQFQRSCSELVAELNEFIPCDLIELNNFRTLITIVLQSKPTLGCFTESLATVMVKPNTDYDRMMLLLFQEVLFGTLDWKKRNTDYGTSEYWIAKAKQDKNANQPVYLDVSILDAGSCRVAHSKTSEQINIALFESHSNVAESEGEISITGTDAFGNVTPLQDKYPVGPKLANLGNVKLFSVNTNEVLALQRYGFKGSQSFPVSSALVQKMSDALLFLASDEKQGISCRAIPSAQSGKQDLLVVYLEGEPEERAPLAEMFGGDTKSFSDADFEVIAQPVLELLNGKVAVNPNLNVRLLSFCPIDKAKKQISLNRCLPVRDVIRAAKDWETGAHNVPEISVWFYDKITKQSVFRLHTTPCPLELAAVVNYVWSADKKSGYSPSFQRALSVADAYDVFLPDSPLSKQKVHIALNLLMARMSNVLVLLGAVITTREWTKLSDVVRWQSVKTVALLGILLYKLGQYKQSFMNEPITQIGRLLALADSLHQQYCKHVRKGETPTQLIGNALFNTALEQPVFALARLAERLTPYQSWARTFHSNDPESGVGLVKYFLGEIASCTASIHVENLPQRMSDADKAKLLLGYLADHPKNETAHQ